MREIKFRAWDGELKEMIRPEEVLSCSFIGLNGEWLGLGDLLKGEGGFELMQYTGLKDKNGVEVYEGDIISAYFDAINGKFLTTYTVEYDEFHSLYPFANFDCYESPMNFTVIGNRYENPELLEAIR